MHRLWVFADSYGDSELAANFCAYPSYIDIISERLNLEVHNHSLVGCSNEYIMNEFFNNIENIRKDDIVIVVITEITRKWFHKNLPKVTQINQLTKAINNKWFNIDKILTSSDFEFYYRMLVENHEYPHKNNSLNYLQMMIDTLSTYQKDIEFDCVVLPAFIQPKTIRDNLNHGLNENLFDISKNEFVDSLISENSQNYIEFRRNHLTEENHVILADKIIKSITNNTHINLGNEFISKNVKNIPEEAKI